ncbi:MAG: YgeY family selenium metabolism-linked hydrolase [Clostridia bacterium]|nr:YgeY family selenium metabolism-linked hydrolase [Clostridia bacterium]
MQKQDLVQLAQKLVQIRSVTGQEKELAQFIKDTMLAMGYDEAVIDEAGNVVGMIKGRGDFRILFDAHIDTVGPGAEADWTYDPFGGQVEGGRLYGRGAADMKGALAAMLCAGAQLVSQKDRLPCTVYISGTVSEEIAEGQCFELVLDRVQPDLVVIGEASELNLKIGQRGRAEILVTAKGKSAHSSNPELAVNAGEHLVDAIYGLRDVKLGQDPLLGEGIMVLTDLISRPYPGQSVIPYEAACTYDRRLLVGETEEGVLGELRDCLAKVAEKSPGLDIDVRIAEERHITYTGYSFTNKRFYPAWKLAEDHPYVRQALAVLQAGGLDPQITAYRFCTNGSASCGKRWIPTIGFGPGRENDAHIVNESISLADLEKAMIGYRALMTCAFNAKI